MKQRKYQMIAFILFTVLFCVMVNTQNGYAATNLDTEQQEASFENAMPSTGDVKSLVFLVEFADADNTIDDLTRMQVNNLFFGDGLSEVNGVYYMDNGYPYESVANYYERSSYGKLKISGDVMDWYKLPHTMSYYENAEFGREEIIEELFGYYDKQLDYSKYDSDNDGYVDSFYILYAGPQGEWASFYWSYVTQPAYEMEYDGVKLNNYVFESANDIYAIAHVAIHETTHLMGLPDYCNYGGEYELGGVGYFDMLDSNYGDHNLFTKMLLGWVEPIVISEDCTIDLKAISDEEAKAIIITPDSNATMFSEYFLVELYNNDGNNTRNVPVEDGAVRIYHVYANLDETNNFIASNSGGYPKLIKMMESDGNEENSLYAFPVCYEEYYYEGMKFGTNTAPSSDFYNNEYTGINIDINSVSKDSANITVSFESVDKVRPTIIGTNGNSILGYCSNMMEKFAIYFNSYIYPGEKLNDIIVYPEGRKEDAETLNANILNGLYNYNILELSTMIEFETNTIYVIDIPEGAVKDAYGNTNERILYKLTVINSSDNAVIADWDIGVVPEKVPDGYLLPSVGWRSYIETENDICEIAPLLKQEQGLKTILWLQCYTKEGQSKINKFVYLDTNIGAWCKWFYQLDNGNYGVVMEYGYVIISSEGEALSTPLTLDVNDLLGEVIDRGEYIDFISYNDIDVYRISKYDGTVEHIISKLGSVSYEDLLGANDDYTSIDRNLSSVKTEKNIISFFNMKYEEYLGGVIRVYRNAGQLMYTDIDKLVYCSVYNEGYTDAKMRPVPGEKSYLFIADNEGFPIVDIEINKVYRGFAGCQIYKLDDGYLVGIGCKIIRLDNKYNVKWIHVFGEDFNGVTTAYVKNEKVYIISSDKVYILDDLDTVLISAVNQFAFKLESGIKVKENENKLILPGDMTLAQFRDSIEGDYSEINFFTKDFEIITDEGKVYEDSFVEIISKDEMYKWYYRLEYDIVPTGVSLDKTSVTLSNIDETVNLIAIVSPNDATNKLVIWKSSNDAVATVSSNGVVTAVGNGTATIKVTTVSGDKTAECTVTVKLNGMNKGSDGNWYYYKNGKLDTSYTGMAKNKYGWWYVKNGKLDTTYTGMAKNQYGWWYVKNGKLDTTYTGMARNQYGWWYVKNGKLDTTYTGMAKNEYGWWHMKNGKLDTTYTGMARNQYGWWHMKNGKLDTTYTGMAKNEYGWWHMKNGKLDLTYTGISTNQYGMWYVKNGKLDTTYTGTATHKDQTYNVKNGKVIK